MKAMILNNESYIELIKDINSFIKHVEVVSVNYSVAPAGNPHKYLYSCLIMYNKEV